MDVSSPTRRRRWLKPAIVVGAIAAALLPVALFAGHQWADVTGTGEVHTSVTSMTNAACFPGPAEAGVSNFNPLTEQKRQGAAAVGYRCLSRAALSSAVLDPTIDFSGMPFTDDDLVAQVGLTVGGAPLAVADANQFVKVEGILNASISIGNAPGFFACYYLVLDTNDPGNRSHVLCANFFTQLGLQVLPISWVFVATPGPHTFKLYARAGIDGQVLAVSAASVVATTHTFGPTGTDTLSAP